jgi:hypothetical protein
MVSKRKLAANRRNAKKSTGPKSAKGKRIVSKNALVHGLRSQRWPVLPFEDQEEYRAFAKSVEEDYQPAGIVQREIVSHIALNLWKLRRVPEIEQALLEEQLDRNVRRLQDMKDEGEVDENAQLEEPTIGKLLAIQFAADGPNAFAKLEEYRGRLERGLHAAMRRLKQLRDETTGAEMPLRQRAKYEIEEFKRAVDEAHAVKKAVEAQQQKESGTNKATEQEPSDNPRPGHEKQETPLPLPSGEGGGEGASEFHDAHDKQTPSP